MQYEPTADRYEEPELVSGAFMPRPLALVTQISRLSWCDNRVTQLCRCCTGRDPDLSADDCGVLDHNGLHGWRGMWVWFRRGSL